MEDKQNVYFSTKHGLDMKNPDSLRNEGPQVRSHIVQSDSKLEKRSGCPNIKYKSP